MLTIQLHEELKGECIKVNSVSPGFVETDLTGYGEVTAEEGARLPAEYSLTADISGCFGRAGCGLYGDVKGAVAIRGNGLKNFFRQSLRLTGQGGGET